MEKKLTYIGLTEEDINLITFALRRLNETTDFGGIKEDTANLISYIESMKLNN